MENTAQPDIKMDDLPTIAGAPDSQATETDERHQDFNLWTSLLKHQDVMFVLATRYLEPSTFLTLYAISKPFHYLVNSNYTTYMLESARTWASFPSQNLSPKTSTPTTRKPPYTTILEIFPFVNYRYLCIHDPSHRRLPTSNPLSPAPLLTIHHPEAPQTPSLTRCIPTFRYLFLLHHRSRTITSILHSITTIYAHPLPLDLMPPILAKLWYLMDLPTHILRMGLMHNRAFWTDKDLELLMLFFVKLDLCVTDPVDGAGQTELRRMLLGQKGLGVMDRVLRRVEGRNVIEVFRLWVRWADERYWMAERRGGEGDSVLGIPVSEFGRMGRAGWKVRGVEGPCPQEGRFIGVEDLVLMEGVRRGLKLGEKIVDMMVWGYVEEEERRGEE